MAQGGTETQIRELTMYDAYDAYDRRELDNERSEISELTTENEQLRESIRHEAEAGELGWNLANDYQSERDALRAENETLREQVTNLSLYLLSIEQGWTDASDRAALRRLLPGSDKSTPESRAILSRVVSEYRHRAA